MEEMRRPSKSKQVPDLHEVCRCTGKYDGHILKKCSAHHKIISNVRANVVIGVERVPTQRLCYTDSCCTGAVVLEFMQVA